MTEQVEIESVPEALAGQRIDRVVALAADVARSTASQAVTAGQVTIDGAIATKGSTRVELGQHVVIEVDRPDDRLVADLSIEVDVAYIDDHLMVIDKRAGVVVHPGSGVADGTLVHGLLARFPEIAPVGPAERPGIVHRLDRGTSGLLLVARTQAVLDALTEQLRARSIERRYRALVLGHCEADAGVIDAPLGRSQRDATRRAVVADGRQARTHYEVETRFEVRPPAGGEPGTDTATGSRSEVDRAASSYEALVPLTTMLRCRLETGRTHQIRAHLAAIGHPVVGDELYGGSVAATPLAAVATRPFLHAERLSFVHPVTDERVEVTSPLADDLTQVVAAVEQAAG